MDGSGVRGLPRGERARLPHVRRRIAEGQGHGGLPARDGGGADRNPSTERRLEARVARARAARPGRADGRAHVDRPSGRRARRADGAHGAGGQAVRAGRPAGRRHHAPREHPAGEAIPASGAGPQRRGTAVQLLCVRRPGLPRAGPRRVRARPRRQAQGDALASRTRGRGHRSRNSRSEDGSCPRRCGRRRAIRDASDPRRPGPRGVVRIGERPDLPDLDLCPGRRSAGPSAGTTVAAGTRRARRSRSRSRRSKEAATGSRSRAGWPPRRRSCSRSDPATTSSSPTTSTEGRTVCWRTCSRDWGLDALHRGPGGRDGAPAVAPSEHQLVWVETPSNPLLKIVDLPGGRRDRARGRRARRRRQHVRHAGAATTAGAGRRRGRPQRDEVHRRPLRSDRRRDRHERPGVGRTARRSSRTPSGRCRDRWTATWRSAD